MRSVDSRDLLRPLRAGEIVDLSIRFFQHHGLRLLGLTLAPTIASYLVLVFITEFVFPAYFRTNAPGSVGVQVGEVMLTTLVALFAGVPLLGLGLNYATGIAVRVVSCSVLALPIDEQQALRDARRSLSSATALSLGIVLKALGVLLVSGALLLASALVKGSSLAPLAAGIASIGLAVGFLVAPFILYHYALAVPVLILENADPKTALRRSRELLKRVPYHTAGSETVISLWLVMLLVGGVLFASILTIWNLLGVQGWLANLLGGGLWGAMLLPALGYVPLFFALWAVTPFWAVGATLLYYDRRVRLEAYDIDVLAKDVLLADRRKVLL